MTSFLKIWEDIQTYKEKSIWRSIQRLQQCSQGLPAAHQEWGIEQILLQSFRKNQFFFSFFMLFPPKSYLSLIEGKLLHNIVLASAIHQHESAIGIHVSPPSFTSLPPSTPPIYKTDNQWEFAVWLREIKYGLCTKSWFWLWPSSTMRE